MDYFLTIFVFQVAISLAMGKCSFTGQWLQPDAPACPAGWQPMRGLITTRCFKLVAEPKPFADAKQDCIDQHGQLVSMDDRKYHSKLVAHMMFDSPQKDDLKDGVWIGGQR